MAKKRNLLHERIVYKPFEYPQVYEYWLNQQQAHWLHTEVPMMSDLNDWNAFKTIKNEPSLEIVVSENNPQEFIRE